MGDDEPLFVDYSKGLPEDLDEETIALLKLARMHNAAKRMFVSEFDVKKRSAEKGIPFVQARRELLGESKRERGALVNKSLKLLAPLLSKEARQQLGIKGVGRPVGSKSLNIKYSHSELYLKLAAFIKAYYAQEDKEPTQDKAAKALGLKYAKKLQRLLGSFGETRDWRELVETLLAEGK
ncbi:MAG: hypothetical protein QOH51_2949 [Acidobacteriota bacterium]|nr:hypothetical protein [Acidobacteriota bacterium]